MSSDRAAQLVEAGIWLKLSGDREGARKLFERALKLDPGNEKAAQLLAGVVAPAEETEPRSPQQHQQAVAPAIASSIGAHPFERPVSNTVSSSESDWGVASSFRPPSPAPSLEGDWGRLTGASTPVPQVDPGTLGSAPEKPFSSSGSGVSSTPKNTLLFGPAAKNPSTAGRTMQLFPAASDAPTPRTTLQLFGTVDDLQQDAQTIELGGDPGPEAPPSSTPPLFGYGPTDSQVSAPSPSTPPLFASLAAEPPAPRTSAETTGQAWAWSSTSPPPKPVDPDVHPEPRPSPSLAPRAESAWDNRSNPGIKLEAVAGRDKALDLLSSDSKVVRSPDARKEEIRAILRGARDLLDLDDHSGAMELILKAQEIGPDDPDVLVMRVRSEKTLLAMFESKLGKLETIPRVLLKDDEIIWLNLDHRAGFVLAQIDGTVSFDDLFSVSGMSRIDTARILAQLVEEGVISRG